MTGKTYTKLSIGGFQFCKHKSIDELNLQNAITIDHNCHIGMHVNLVHASPFHALSNNIMYNNNQQSFQNSMYIQPYFVHYTQQSVNVSLQASDSTITLENNTFSLKYNNYKPTKNMELDCIQFKPDSTSSICISFDFVPQWSAHYKYKNKNVFALQIGSNVYYGNDIYNVSQSGVHPAYIYYSEIIPYSDVFINDGVAELKTLKIGMCMIKCVPSSMANSCYTFAKSQNKSLVAIINGK